MFLIGRLSVLSSSTISVVPTRLKKTNKCFFKENYIVPHCASTVGIGVQNSATECRSPLSFIPLVSLNYIYFYNSVDKEIMKPTLAEAKVVVLLKIVLIFVSPVMGPLAPLVCVKS